MLLSCLNILDTVCVCVCVCRMDTVCAASHVLKQLLATHSGHDFCSDYKANKDAAADPLFQYLHPFKTANKRKVCLRSSTLLLYRISKAPNINLKKESSLRHCTSFKRKTISRARLT